VNKTAPEMTSALASCRSALWACVAQSCALNVLALSGSIYMMLVYDMVIPSRNGASLAGLLIILVVAYAFQAAFEGLRSKTTRQAAAAIGAKLEPRVSEISRSAALKGSRAADPIRDLDAVRSFASGPGPAAFLDLPWILLFVAVLSLLHPWLGIVTAAGAVALAALTWFTEKALSEPSRKAEGSQLARSTLLEERRRSAATLKALGMDARMDRRLTAVSGEGMRIGERLQSTTARLAGLSRTARMLLQSLVLTVGALLVIDGRASGGVIFASSILSARALAPVDAAIANWRGLSAARRAWERLSSAMKAEPARERPMALPAPGRELSVESLSSSPPGAEEATLHDVSFKVPAGHVVALVGPSASGKSTLLRAIAGAWPTLEGAIRLDGASLDQWHPDDLGPHLGYLPQDVQLLDGTVAENISRLDPEMKPEGVVEAARAAGCHEMVLRLPNGYATRIGDGGLGLSSGQRQRIGLARALYGSPFLVLLDEPNSNLDPEGEQALARAMMGVRERGGICIVAAHRPSALSSCGLAMVLKDGRLVAYGPRDKVLKTPSQVTQIRPDAAQEARA
jgi:PrtD family type I secretion system ABC transporter